MSRANLGTIDPNTKSGTDLATDLTAFEAAWLSGHSNATATRPTYAVAKTIWVNDSASIWIVNMFDGTDDIPIGTIDPTTNKFIPGASAATAFADIKQAATTTTTTGVVELATQAEVDGGTGTNLVVTSTTLDSTTKLKLQAEQATTSGTSIDFTSIPSNIRKIEVLFAGVSTTGTSIPMLQLGDSGGFEATGYLGASSGLSTTVTTTAHSTGFLLKEAHVATNIYHGSLTLVLEDSTANTWTISGNLGLSDIAATTIVAGTKTLSAALTQIRLTTVGGSDTFDAGAVNISYQ